MPNQSDATKLVRYHGGMWGAFFPFALFVVGVVTLALIGAPDERGFWPILVIALITSLFLARDRSEFCASVIEGMSRPIVMIMIMAWSLASIIGVLLTATGFVEALIWISGHLRLSGWSFVGVSFLICCVVSTATGTSFGTILICGPILYPAGGLLGADLPTLAGAILGGATFGDSISPISDTTIASGLSQNADIGGTVRSRLKYVVPGALLALPIYLASAHWGASLPAGSADLAGAPRGLPMVLAPLVVIGLLLAGRHLLHGLLAGVATALLLGVGLGLLAPVELLRLDLENFTARSLLIDGINRSVGISFFTILLLGLVAALEASGFMRRLVDFSSRRASSARAAETWIAAVVGTVVSLTCHSIVAILTVADFTRETGERFGLHPYRRANLLDLTVSSFPFMLPYFIPVILTANTTASGADRGIPKVDPLQVGLHNFFSLVLIFVLVFAIATGYGRRFRADERSAVGAPPLT
jgi:Na+/H+ antiporter NhaC